eukprot:TRINITY_DN1510_c0_g1_i2.p1 TRINITY_DN1510_c0_g1~~TRINITY_DN1510_c0_g1_i2.p1  ORF type:complete len:401 (+),score=124.69 TRINITY_DN1510_c0_g1_i2:944-2146(+)
MSRDVSTEEADSSPGSVFGEGESRPHSAFRPVAPSVIFTLRKDGHHQGDDEKDTLGRSESKRMDKEESSAIPRHIYESYVAASKRIGTTAHHAHSFYQDGESGESDSLLYDPVEEAMIRKWKDMFSSDDGEREENVRRMDATPRTVAMQFGSHGHVVGGLYTRHGLPEYVAERLEKRLAREAQKEHERQMDPVAPTPTPSGRGRKDGRPSTSASARGVTGPMVSSSPPSSQRQMGRIAGISGSGRGRARQSMKSKSSSPGIVVGRSTKRIRDTGTHERPAYSFLPPGSVKRSPKHGRKKEGRVDPCAAARSPPLFVHQDDVLFGVHPVGKGVEKRPRFNPFPKYVTGKDGFEAARLLDSLPYGHEDLDIMSHSKGAFYPNASSLPAGVRGKSGTVFIIQR